MLLEYWYERPIKMGVEQLDLVISGNRLQMHERHQKSLVIDAFVWGTKSRKEEGDSLLSMKSCTSPTHPSLPLVLHPSYFSAFGLPSSTFYLQLLKIIAAVPAKETSSNCRNDPLQSGHQ